MTDCRKKTINKALSGAVNKSTTLYQQNEAHLSLKFVKSQGLFGSQDQRCENYQYCDDYSIGTPQCNFDCATIATPVVLTK